MTSASFAGGAEIGPGVDTASGSLPVAQLVPDQVGVVSNTITVTPGTVAAVDTLDGSINVSKCPPPPGAFGLAVVCGLSEDALVPTVTWTVSSPADAAVATVTDVLDVFAGDAEVGPGLDTVSGSRPVAELVPDQNGVVSNTITVTPGTVAAVDTLTGSINVSSECPAPPPGAFRVLVQCAASSAGVPTVTWTVFSPVDAEVATVTDVLGAFAGAEIGPGADTASGSLPAEGLEPDQDGVVSNTITVTPGTGHRSNSTGPSTCRATVRHQCRCRR